MMMMMTDAVITRCNIDHDNAPTLTTFLSLLSVLDSNLKNRNLTMREFEEFSLFKHD